MTSAYQQIADIIDAALPPVLSAVPADAPAPKAQTHKPAKRRTSSSAEDASLVSPADSRAREGAGRLDAETEENPSTADQADAEGCAEGGAGQNPPKPSSRSAEEEGPGGPRAFGYRVDDLNEEFALVLMGSKAVVFLEQPHAMVEDQTRVLTLDAFNAWFANRFTEVVTADGKLKAITWARAWLQSRRRRQYRGIEFFPDVDNAPGTPGYLNLWSGFAVRPAERNDPRAYATFRDHLLNNVCQGDAALFDWVFGFFAHMVQRPRDRPGVALVMRGIMGSGKTKIGEVMGSLFPRHYFLVDDPRYVTGQFNAHMATCLLLQADEAVWAGDKAAEGRLKGLVTSPIQQIEAKGIDPIRLPNYVRLIMTSNEDWVVPAGKDERRFAVVDVDPRCAKNFDYFREMDEELDSGGREALLADLLAFDLATINIRQIPHTAALLEQKIRSLDTVSSWWLERLMSGTTLGRGTLWNIEVPCQSLYDDYIHVADKYGARRKSEETVFGIQLKKLVPMLDRVKRTTDVLDADGRTSIVKRVWCYQLPPLPAAREAFEKLVKQPIIWPPEDGADASAREGSDTFD